MIGPQSLFLNWQEGCQCRQFRCWSWCRLAGLVSRCVSEIRIRQHAPPPPPAHPPHSGRNGEHNFHKIINKVHQLFISELARLPRLKPCPCLAANNHNSWAPLTLQPAECGAVTSRRRWLLSVPHRAIKIHGNYALYLLTAQHFQPGHWPLLWETEYGSQDVFMTHVVLLLFSCTETR